MSTDYIEIRLYPQDCVTCCLYNALGDNVSQAICTHHSILTIHKVSAGVFPSCCQQVGELLLGSGDGVHLDSLGGTSSGHNNCVLQLNRAGFPANKDIKTWNDWRLNSERL